MRTGSFNDRLAVNRLHKAHVPKRAVQILRCLLKRIGHGTKTQKGRASTGSPLQRAADLHRFEILSGIRARSLAARIAHCGRGIHGKSRVEQKPCFSFVGGRHHGHIRHAAEFSDIENPLMCCAVRPYDAAAVDGKHHRKILQRHIMNELIECALQKCGIDRYNGLQTAACQTGSISDGMLLGNGHIAIAFRKVFLKFNETRALTHGRCDGIKAMVAGCHTVHPAAEDLRIGWRRGFSGLDDADFRIERRHAVIKRRIGFGKGIALTLDSGRMEHHRAVHLPEIFQDFNERKDVMSVDRTVVIEVKRGKKRGLRAEKPDGLPFHELSHFPKMRHGLEHALADLAGAVEGSRRDDLG